MAGIKEPVRLREKKLANGNISLYLDCYHNGERSYEFLKLYLIPETDREAKRRNRDTMEMALALKAKRVVALQEGAHGLTNHGAEQTLFCEYYEVQMNKRKGSTLRIWTATWRSIERYDKRANRRMLSDITSSWINGYIASVKTLKPNTINVYLVVISACLNEAVREGYLANNPICRVMRPKAEQSVRSYLTIDEVRKLISVELPAKQEIFRRAFLFSCLTGLRKSDIEKLTWGEVYNNGEHTRLVFRQQKTKGQEYLDINKQAAALLGDRGADDELVFEYIYTSTATYRLVNWLKAAGINKRVTFHSARHCRFYFLLKFNHLQNISA